MSKILEWIKGRKEECSLMDTWTQVINDNAAAARELAEALRKEDDA